MKTFLLTMIGITLMEVLLSAYAGSESMKSAVHLLCGTAMAVLVLSRVLGFDYAGYAAALARTESSGGWNVEVASENGDPALRRCCHPHLEHGRILVSHGCDAGFGARAGENRCIGSDAGK